jgi:hypothetical protein
MNEHELHLSSFWVNIVIILGEYLSKVIDYYSFSRVLFNLDFEYHAPSSGLALWCQIIISFGRIPFSKYSILQILSKIPFFTLQNIISLNIILFSHLFFI